MRAPFDPYGAASPAIDQQLGDAFQVVRFVARHIPEIASVAYHMEGLYKLVSAGGKANADLLGLPPEAVNLGEMEGSIIPDDSTVYAALQIIATFVENLKQQTDNLLSDMGNFTGEIIPDQVNLHDTLQALEIAIERVFAEAPVLSTEEQAEEGMDNTTVMSPLRVKQAIEAQTGTAKANAQILGVEGDASNMGEWTSPLITDNGSAKDAIEEVAAAVAGFSEFQQPETGSQVRDIMDKVSELKSINDFSGADPTGAGNSSTALGNADAAGVAVIPVGTYLIGTSRTLSRPPIILGGILKIANGVTLTMPGVLAGAVEQIFDVSLGGRVVFNPPVPDCYPEWFGTDDQVAITAALATGSPVALGARNYAVSSITAVPYGAVMRGRSYERTTITSNSTTAHAIQLNDGAYTLSDFCVDRSVVPTSGAGIWSIDGTFGTLRNIRSRNHYDGFRMGATARGEAISLRAESNYRHGFLFDTTVALPASQWQCQNLLSQFNNGRGYNFVAASLDTTAPVMENCGSYANSGGGIIWDGVAGTSWNDLHQTLCYSSFDGNTGQRFNNLGRNNQIDKYFGEYAGRVGTGRGQATAASGVGAGFAIEGTCRTDSSLMLSMVGQGNSYQGFSAYTNNLKKLILDKCIFQNNGLSGTNTSGISITDLTNTATSFVSGCISGNELAYTSQTFGLSVNSTAVANRTYVVGCDFSGNTTGATSPAASNFNGGTGVVATRLT